MLLGILLCIAFSHLILLPGAGAGAGAEAEAGAADCSRTCGSSTVPYPFGFSAGCGIRLSCKSTNSNSTVLVGGTYPVWNITPDSLLLDVAPSCHRPVGAAVGLLFGPNYAMTWRNGLFLRNCTASAAADSRCLLPTSLATQISRREDLASCGERADNVTCYSSGRADGFFSPANATASGCGYVFTSALYTAGVAGDEMPAIVFGAAELGWWLNGPCRCSADATCVPVAVPGNATGFRCSCRAGFVGDGFADGDGCVRAAGRCGASNRKKFGDCGGRARVGLLIGGIIAGASLLLGLVLLLCSAARRRKWAVASSEQTKHLLRLSEAAPCPVAVYSYKDMERATNAFSDAHKLGTGAYATVYVGKLPEGLVAVKRIRRGDPSSPSSSAMNEIRLISCVRHPNLVRLLGCCVDRGEQILVYEFVPNGTLAQHLRRGGGVGGRGRGGLPWRARLGIGAEAARAVAYLHTALQPPIYHRDIKSTNILLDGELRPKIADFGLSRAGVGAGAESSSHVSTAPQGTPGYLDPQYHQDFHLTDKSDVYSFGVVLVEMLTALKVVDFERPPAEVNLAALALDRIGKGRLEDIVDPLLLLPPPDDAEADEGEWVMDSVRRVAELAFRCLAFHKDVRPSMTEVAEELERIRLSAPASASEEEEEDVVEVLGSGSEAGEKLEGKRRRRRRSRGVRLDEKARVDSPVSVQDVLWVSEHSSSPSTNGSIPRFVL